MSSSYLAVTPASQGSRASSGASVSSAGRSTALCDARAKQVCHAEDTPVAVRRTSDGLRAPTRKPDKRPPPKLRRLYGSHFRPVFLPESYSDESPIQLQQPQAEDTTDRSLFLRTQAPSEFLPASSAPVARSTTRFDAEGHDHTRGLQKDLFYWSPFLTCSKCNHMAIIDASAARMFGAPAHPSAKEKLELEYIPRCPECGSTQDWWMGAHNLLQLIGASKKEMEELLRRQKKGAKMIQRAYRAHLRRCWARAQRHKQILRAMLEFRAAAAIASIVRGRLGRRRAVVWKNVKVLKRAHPKLIKRAVTTRSEKKKVFWYKPEQLKQLHDDYFILCERTGFSPPRMLVEENIIEIARRVLEREAYLATRIQKRWRGIQVRRFIVIYRREVIRVREIRVGAIFRIQRLFRGFVARKVIEKIKVGKAKKQLFANYIAGRFKQQERHDKKVRHQRLMVKYNKERQEERTARLTGLTHPGAAGGRKMAAFHQSAWGCDEVSGLVEDHVVEETKILQRAQDKEDALGVRGDFVRQQQQQGRAYQLYHKEEIRQRSLHYIEKYSHEQAPRDTKALLATHNRKGAKYQYPTTVNDDPLAALYEGTDQEAAYLAKRAKLKAKHDARSTGRAPETTNPRSALRRALASG